MLFVCSARAVSFPDQIHRQASDASTSEPWKECWLHPLAGSGASVLLHILELWKKKKRKQGHKLRLKEPLESLHCPPDKFY